MILKEGGVLHLEKYFVKSKYKGENGKDYTEYFCSRDGFTLLTMGFTGVAALTWKLKYIEAFNAMEAALRERQTSDWLQTREKGNLIRRNETDIIKSLILYAEEQGSKNMAKRAYIIYSKLVNDIVGIEAGCRDTVNHKQLMTIAMLEDMISKTIEEEMQKGVYYKTIYKICKDKVRRFAELTYLKAS